MNINGNGLFYDSTSDSIKKKKEFLAEQNWIEVAPNYYADPKNPTEWQRLEVAAKMARAWLNRKRPAPEPVWLSPDYLPYLDEANAWPVKMLSPTDLEALRIHDAKKLTKHPFTFDVECYGNFFYVAFKSILNGGVTDVELSDDRPLNKIKLEWMLNNFLMVGFNSIKYDMIICALALAGCSTIQMKNASDSLIIDKARGGDVLRTYGAKPIRKCDHIDIKEVAPLMASLKIYGGRLHTKKMQDLPFPPEAALNAPQRQITRFYCVNDLDQTEELITTLQGQVKLREDMSKQYGLDLRSKSDAQIAEAVLVSELKRELNVDRLPEPPVEPGRVYKYNPPAFLNYKTPLMQNVLETVAQSDFIVAEKGNIKMPKGLSDLKIKIGESTYKLGIGGLHSTESCASHKVTDDMVLKDVDVTSYYPFIILNLGVFPPHLGERFLPVYRSIVNRRIEAKKAGNKLIANSLKIVINGSFGKLGSAYSSLYAPNLLIQVTLTGQLSLLMLVERMELAGFPVVSANTDGIVIKAPKSVEPQIDEIVKQWEIETGFDTEETFYSALYSRDVNNYIAVTHPDTWRAEDTAADKVKTKGIFANPGLSKNPQNRICVDAIIELLINGTPVEKTIKDCKDIIKFCSVRSVTGGAVKVYDDETLPGEYLGKAIRWYYSNQCGGEIVYAKNGNKVPRSESAQPLMELPETFPSDMDYLWYITEANEILNQIGFENAS